MSTNTKDQEEQKQKQAAAATAAAAAPRASTVKERIDKIERTVAGLTKSHSFGVAVTNSNEPAVNNASSSSVVLDVLD